MAKATSTKQENFKELDFIEFNFPEYGVTIKAKNIEEATEKLNQIINA